MCLHEQTEPVRLVDIFILASLLTFYDPYSLFKFLKFYLYLVCLLFIVQ